MIPFPQKIRGLLRKIHYSLFKTIYPLGHYYSPIISKREILKREQQIFNIDQKKTKGVDLNEPEQLKLLKQLVGYYEELPFTDNKKSGLRYSYNNIFYSYSDAIFLYCMLRHFKPKRVIEIGSGFSSAVMLDTNEYFMDNKIQCIFIDPDSDRLLSCFKINDRENHKIIKTYVQDVDLDLFSQLQENDILFIDSSHVAKTGSDVNFILFDILPRLKKGVLIHFHDIFYPFEYPKKWALEGRSWNEAYLLKAFLSYNFKYKIILMNTFLEYYHEGWFAQNMPLCLKQKGGSIWFTSGPT